jgi:hypothetical protein
MAVVEDKHTPEGMVHFSRTIGTQQELMEGGEPQTCNTTVQFTGSVVQGDVWDARLNGRRTGTDSILVGCCNVEGKGLQCGWNRF